MTEPKLMTEAEWIDRLMNLGVCDGFGPLLDDLRERGLIAPEPDPLDAVWEEYGRIPGSASHCPPSERTAAFRKAMAIVGMELAQPPLTRERFFDAVAKGYDKGRDRLGKLTGSDIDYLHAALTERQP